MEYLFYILINLNKCYKTKKKKKKKKKKKN